MTHPQLGGGLDVQTLQIVQQQVTIYIGWTASSNYCTETDGTAHRHLQFSNPQRQTQAQTMGGQLIRNLTDLSC